MGSGNGQCAPQSSAAVRLFQPEFKAHHEVDPCLGRWPHGRDDRLGLFLGHTTRRCQKPPQPPPLGSFLSPSFPVRILAHSVPRRFWPQEIRRGHGNRRCRHFSYTRHDNHVYRGNRSRKARSWREDNGKPIRVAPQTLKTGPIPKSILGASSCDHAFSVAPATSAAAEDLQTADTFAARP